MELKKEAHFDAVTRRARLAHIYRPAAAFDLIFVSSVAANFASVYAITPGPKVRRNSVESRVRLSVRCRTA